MTALRTKTLRDLRTHRGQVLSIAALVACGVMVVISMRSTYETIRDTRDAYYVSQRFADVFATVKRAPESLRPRIAALPGVGAVETRVVLAATLDVRGKRDPAVGQFVSVPSPARPMLNELHIFSGRYVAPDRNDEALVSVLFARANNLQVGDSLGAVINGRWQRIRIVGIATSPEYVFEIGSAGVIVDNRNFGILWMRREALAAAAGMEGAFNSVTLGLAPEAKARGVIDALDDLLGPYGAVGAVDRTNQLSARIISQELMQLDGIAKVFPIFFLAIAAFLLNVVLSRLVSTQRTEIGALKSFGYSNRAIGMHFLAFAVSAIAIGAVLGVLSGMWLGTVYTKMYTRFFGLPSLTHHTQWDTAAAAIAICGGAAVVGAMSAVRAAVRLPPAEALRPPSPMRFRPLLLERLGLARALSPAVRMVLRNLERRPLRTGASIFGIALASAVLVAGMYPFDAISSVIDIQFRRGQRDDLAVTFSSPRAIGAVRELETMAGVRHVEPFRSTAVRARHEQYTRTVPLLGIERGGTLRNLIDVDGVTYAMPSGGAVLSASLARVLHVAAGDTVRAQLLERGEEVRPLVVAGVFDEPMGFGIYMSREAVNHLLREDDLLSGAYLSIVRGSEAGVVTALQARPLVAATTSRAALLEYFERSVAESIAVSATIVILAAVIIAVGVIYNGSRVALAERGRELASLRVLGFTRGEVSRLFLGEQGTITLLALPLGSVLGFGLATILARAFATEEYSFPVMINRSTYILAAGVVLVTAVVVSFAVRRRIDRLDMIATLKTGE